MDPLAPAVLTFVLIVVFVDGVEIRLGVIRESELVATARQFRLAAALHRSVRQAAKWLRSVNEPLGSHYATF